MAIALLAFCCCCFVDVCLFRAVVPVRDQDEDVRSSFERHDVPPQSRPHCLCQQRGHLGKAAGYFHDPSIIKNRITAAKNHLRCEYLDLPAGDSPCKPERSSLDSLPQCISWFVIAKFSSNENHNCDNDDYDYPARALRALGLLLADGAPTVGGGKTF